MANDDYSYPREEEMMCEWGSDLHAMCFSRPMFEWEKMSTLEKVGTVAVLAPVVAIGAAASAVGSVIDMVTGGND